MRFLCLLGVDRSVDHLLHLVTAVLAPPVVLPVAVAAEKENDAHAAAAVAAVGVVVVTVIATVMTATAIAVENGIETVRAIHPLDL